MKRFFVLVITSLLILSCSSNYETKLAATAWNIVKMEFNPDSLNTESPSWMINSYIEDPYVEFRNDTCYKLFSKVDYTYKLEGSKMHIENSKDDVTIRQLTSDMLVIDIHVDSVGVYTTTYKAVPFEHHPFDVVIYALCREKEYMLQDFATGKDSLYAFRIDVSPKALQEKGNNIAEDIKATIDKTLNIEFVTEKDCPTSSYGITYNSYTWKSEKFTVSLRNYFGKIDDAEPVRYYSSELEIYE